MSAGATDKPLEPWDLEVDAGEPSRAEAIVSRISMVCLVSGGVALIILVIFGKITYGWALPLAVEASLVFVALPLLLGCLFLQVASSMSRKREDDARKSAWDSYVSERSAQSTEGEPPEGDHADLADASSAEAGSPGAGGA